MISSVDFEQALQQMWDEYRVPNPRHVYVNPALMLHLAAHRTGGGNSHQRRVWRRAWTPRSTQHD